MKNNITFQMIFKGFDLVVYWAITCHTSLLTEATKDDGTYLGLDKGPPELESSSKDSGSKLHSNPLSMII